MVTIPPHPPQSTFITMYTIIFTCYRCGTPATSSPLQSIQQNHMSESDDSVLTKIKDPIVMVFMFVAILLLLVIIAMSVGMYKMRMRRPRIKKRIIVNKNVTPLTCRPQQNSEQCEITIENCCNMNICETVSNYSVTLTKTTTL